MFFFCHMLLQVTKYTDIPCQMLFAKGLPEFVFKDIDTGKAASRCKFTFEVPIWQFDFISRINETVTVRINQKVVAIALT